MKQKLFISYSRHQTPFVDRFADYMEDQGYPLWLDYQRLVPAKPWMEQIASGIAEVDVFLLIVSKESLASQNVEAEWRRALELKKRIVLVIFEAVPLPPELQNFEWVDFRSRYGGSLRQLIKLVDAPQAAAESAAPQSGFKASFPFWLSLVLSVLLIVGSIPVWWTILVPYILIPLPRRIYKRDYIFSRVVPILLLLPVLTLFSATFFTEGGIFYGLSNFYNYLLFPTFLISWLLLGVLLLPAMQRRAMPQAARIHFANPLMVDIKTPRSVLFAIDYAPEDSRYAEGLTRGLEKYGHRIASDGEPVEAAFVLISTYKSQTKYDPDHQAVYPIILQATDSIDPALERIQWIDFRNGIRQMDKLAKLLPEPQRLLEALAVAPTGAQEVFPLAVNALQYFFAFTGILGGGGMLVSMAAFVALILNGEIGQVQLSKLIFVAVNGILLAVAILYCLRGLRTRRSGTAALYPLVLLTIFQVMIYFVNVTTISTTNGLDKDLMKKLLSAAMGSILSFLAFPFALLIILPILIFRWQELIRWLPNTQGRTAGPVERLLLLHSPLNSRARVYQVLFHTILLLLYFLIVISFQTPNVSNVLICFGSMAFLALLFRLLAGHVARSL